MREKISSLCVFCGSSPGVRPEYTQAAIHLGRTLACRGITLVYGGGSVGLMGQLADAALAAGGHVVGVIPKALATREVAHASLPDLRVVATMHERKALMADLSQGFIALPGGFGTLEELFEVLTWAQLGIHPKPCALLNIGGYFDRLIDFLDYSVEQQFVRPEHRSMLLVDASADALLDRMAAFQAPHVRKWISRSAT